jgi:uncharacterized protein YbjT (DUF2867 family)
MYEPFFLPAIALVHPRTFDEALKNVTGIFLVTGYTVDMLVQSKTLIDAAKRNGVNHVVHLGAFTRERDTYTTVFAWHQMIECSGSRAIVAAGLGKAACQRVVGNCG